MMSGIDLVLLLMVALSIFNGMRKGVIAAVLGLIGWIVAVVLAIRWHALLLPWMLPVTTQPMLQHALAFAAVVLFTVLLLGVLGWLLDKTLAQLKLGWLNRIAGGVFALCKSVLVIAVFVHIFSGWFGTFQWWRQSVIIEAISPYAKAITAASQHAAQRISRQVHHSIAPSDDVIERR